MSTYGNVILHCFYSRTLKNPGSRLKRKTKKRDTKQFPVKVKKKKIKTLNTLNVVLVTYQTYAGCLVL